MIIEQLNTLLVTMDDTSNEYIIAYYILHHGNEIIELKMIDVLKDIGISKSTLTRFCQLLGYKNFTEVQYQTFLEWNSMQKYHNDVEQDEKYTYLRSLIVNKKRIILFGDGYSLSPLLIYKQIFLNIGIQLEMKFHYNRPIEVLDQYQLNENDIVLYVSICQTNLDLYLSIFDHYIEMIDYLKEKNISFLYIGKMARDNNKEDYIEIHEHQNISDDIHELCDIFENVYNILDK